MSVKMEEEKSKEQLLEEIEDLRNKISKLEDQKDPKEHEDVDILTRLPEKEIILNSVSDLMIYMDTHMKVIWANKAAYDSLNLSIDEPEKVLGKYCYGLWRDSEEPCKGCPVLKSLKTGQQEELEVSAPSGRIYYVKGFPVHDSEGNVVGVFEVAQDFTERKRIEEALRESEEKYRELVERANDGIVIIQDKKVKYANPMSAKMWGGTLEEFVGMPFTEFVHPDEIAKISDYYQRRMAGEDVPNIYETIIKRKNGEIAHAELNTGLTTFNGEPADLVIVRDVTDRKKAAEDLKDSEEKLKNIVYGTPTPTFVINENHQVIYWNKALEEETNIKAEEVMGKSDHWKAFYSYERPCMADFIVDRDLEDIPKFYNGKYSASKLVEEAYEATDFFPSLGENGKWLYFTAAPIKDSKGNIIGAIETLEDITEQKMAEEVLKKSEKQYRDLVDNALVGVYKTNLEGDILFANQASAGMFGYDSVEDMMQDTILSRFINLDDRRIAIEKLKKEGILKDYEYELITKSGKKINVLLSAKLDGDVISVMMRDITSEKIAQEQLKKALREKEMLLKEIHHRVKNNLMTISSLLNVQSQFIEDEKTVEVLKKSQTRAHSMALIHERLYGSKTDYKSVNFGEYIRNLTKDIFNTYLVDKGGINLNLHVEDLDLDINTTIPLGLILNELISNCIKYAFPDGKKGEINIEFKLEDGFFVLEVNDNGVGFPKDLDFKNTKSLGLQLVKGLTDQIDGSLEMHTNGGTTFRVKFQEDRHDLDNYKNNNI